MTRLGLAVTVLLAAACGDVDDLRAGGVRAAGFEIPGRGDTVFAVDWARGECFYWSRPR